MQAFLRSLAVLAFLSVGVGACAADSSKIEGIYLSSVQSFNKYGSSIYYEFYVLYKDGRAFNGVPPEGPEALDLAAAQKADPTMVGTWKESGGNVTITWGGARQPSVFPRKSDGSLDLKEGVSTRLAPLPDGQTIGGTYSRLAVAKGNGGMVSGSKTIVFRPNGSYSGTMVGALAAPGAGGKSVERKDEGTYSIKGYTITFSGGGAQMLATYKKEPPASPEIIYLGGGYMLRQ